MRYVSPHLCRKVDPRPTKVPSVDGRFVPETVASFGNGFHLAMNAGCSAIINTLIFTQSIFRLLSGSPDDLIVIDR
jgi:hypothetical protein